jgi:GNAT superfamily N-acetyltransferase
MSSPGDLARCASVKKSLKASRKGVSLLPSVAHLRAYSDTTAVMQPSSPQRESFLTAERFGYAASSSSSDTLADLAKGETGTKLQHSTASDDDTADQLAAQMGAVAHGSVSTANSAAVDLARKVSVSSAFRPDPTQSVIAAQIANEQSANDQSANTQSADSQSANVPATTASSLGNLAVTSSAASGGETIANVPFSQVTRYGGNEIASWHKTSAPGEQPVGGGTRMPRNRHTANAAAGGLVQTQIQAGPAAIITCNYCRLTFNRTLPADRAAHQSRHDDVRFGIAVVNPMPVHHCHDIRILEQGLGGDSIIRVNCHSSPYYKDLVMDVMNTHVEPLLGTFPLEPKNIWSEIQDPRVKLGEGADMTKKIPRYTVYMYVKAVGNPATTRVISFLLAENITEGFEAYRDEIIEDEYGPIPGECGLGGEEFMVYTYNRSKTHEAVIGVDRIWTHPDHQKRGYATLLLDKARAHFIYGYTVPRVHVAWTIPTYKGSNLAISYLKGEGDYSYLVYDPVN